MKKFLVSILIITIQISSCIHGNTAGTILQTNDDSVVLLKKRIDEIKHDPFMYEYDYDNLYDLADRIKPYCDNFKGADKSALPEIYIFCAAMASRKCYRENFKNDTAIKCNSQPYIIDCSVKARDIAKTCGDTTSINYTNALQFLAVAYEELRQFNKALQLRFEVLAIRQKTSEGWDDRPAFACYEIGRTYLLSGDIKNADTYFKKVIAIQKTIQSKYLSMDMDSIKAFQKRYKSILQ
jgi:tetratricopeptide (TPR) repeat protein